MHFLNIHFLRCINAVGCVKKRHAPRCIHERQAILSVKQICTTILACAFDWMFLSTFLLFDNSLVCIETYSFSKTVIKTLLLYSIMIRSRLQKSYGDFVYSNYEWCIFYMINNQSQLLCEFNANDVTSTVNENFSSAVGVSCRLKVIAAVGFPVLN